MTLSLRRTCAILTMLWTFIPVYAGAAETSQGKPAAVLALRSYQRLEQRLREITTMAKTPGLADMALGMVQLQLAGLGGLDRQRPISIVVPTVSLTGQPPVAVLLPYTEREAIVQTLRSFFPQTIVENGEKLSLQGGPLPAFGRLDAKASVIVVATAPEAVYGFDTALTGALFGTQDDGPDLVLRVDGDAVKHQLDSAWKGMLAGMEQFWQAALQKAVDDKSVAATDTAALTASMGMMQKGIRQVLEDFVQGDMRLTLAPTGWILDLASTMRADSSSAAFLHAQTGHTSRAGQLFAPNPNAFMRLVYTIHMTDSLRQEMLALLPALRQGLEAKLAALPSRTPEQQAAGKEAIATYFSLIEQWCAQKELEAAGELQAQDAGFGVTGWLPFVDSTRTLTTILGVLEKLPLFTGDAVAKVTREAGQHQGTAVHRLEGPATGTPEVPNTAFLAAQADILTFHLGNSPAPLHGLLDRIRGLNTRPPAQTDALMHMEVFLAPILKLSMNKGQAGSKDPMSQALITRLQQGPNEPMQLDLLTGQDAATLRYTFPGTLVQGVAEVMGEQITQQLRGGEKKGSEKKSGEKPGNGSKPKK